jgi:HSP20 family protein
MTVMRNWMDRFLDEGRFGSQAGGQGDGSYGLALDVSETEDSYIVRASIPGIDPEDLNITINNNVLTIQGETSEEEEEEDERYHVRERRFGVFVRSVVLPSPVDRENVEATYEDGVLTLRLPKSEENKPRRISVNPNRMLAADSQNPETGEAGSSSQHRGNGKARSGRRGKSQRAANGGNGGSKRQSKSTTGEQASSGQTMEGVERPR